jgi:hypothetical protein
MMSLLLLCGVVLAADEPARSDGKPAQADLAVYQEAAARAGHDANAQVKLALWCEAHGLSAERIKHLALATLSDPGNAAARGLLGLVLYRGKWLRPDDVSRQTRDDPARQAILREYLDRRARAADKPDDQWRLALWCDQNGLKEQTTVHLRRVVTLDPKREAAWRRLGFKKQGSQWVKPELAAAEKAEFEAQRHANKTWKPRLERLGEALAARERLKRVAAEEALGQITDPRAVPMVWAVFVRGDQARQRDAVQILGQINASGSSRALALLGVFSPWAEIRQSAAAILRQRDPRDVAVLLVGLLRDPIKYKVRSVNGPGSQGELLIEGKDANVRRLYSPLAPPTLMPGFQLGMDQNGMLVANRVFESYGTSQFFGQVSFQGLDANRAAGVLQQMGLSPAQSKQLGQTVAKNVNPVILGTPNPETRMLEMTIASRVEDSVTIPIGQMMADAQNSALAAQQQLGRDVQSIEANNAELAVTNDRVRNIIKEYSGQDFGQDQQAWQRWAVDLQGYAVQPAMSVQSPPPTFDEQVPIDYRPQAGPPMIAETVNTQVTQVVRFSHSCFGAGTLVRTLDGPRAIEAIRAGDPVLTQNTTTGLLSYQPVVMAYHNPPNSTFRIELGTEPIVATGIHRFWKAGQGWVMARELKPGDRLRTVGGMAVVKAIEPDKVQPVFNLQLADGDSFFVGEQGVLAHDNSIVTPTEKPFDGVPVLGEQQAQLGP